MFPQLLALCRFAVPAIFPRAIPFFVSRFLRTIASATGLILLLFSLPAICQTTIKGTVRDKVTRQPIPAVTVSFLGLNGGIVSDKDGFFKIHTNKVIKSVRFSAVGYKVYHHSMGNKEVPHLDIELEESANNLDDVRIVVSKKAKYSNKKNPAVELIRSVIDNRDKNRKKQDSTVVFNQYEKLNLSLSMAASEVSKSTLLKKFPFLAKTTDTVRQPGRAIVPLFMRERLTMYQETKDHLDDKSLLLNEQQSRIDQYFDEDGIDEYLNHIYQHVDIYDHDIALGSQRFLSPISSIATEFYKYFIVDTLKETVPHVVHLMFSPRNKQDQLFMGEMFIPLDGNYAVKTVRLYLNKAVNINWVNDFSVKIDYAKDPKGQYYISQSITSMDLGLFKGKHSIFGERTLFTVDYRLPGPDFVFPLKPLIAKKRAEQTFIRPLNLSTLEQNAYNNIDSLKSSPKFRRFMGVTALILTGYHKAGPIDIGPITSFYSFNEIEGTRVRLSARTNEDFNDKIVLDAGLAYGTKDEKWKHSAGLVYSFKPEGVFRFPVNSFTIRHSYETQIPGQDLSFLEEDNVLLSFKRGVDNKRLYNLKWSGEYFRELESHVSFRLGYRNQRFTPVGSLVFQPASGADAVENLRLSEFTSELRWAPNEQFYQGKRFRRPIKNGYPVFTLRASAAFKDFLHGDYSYQNLSLNIYKRVYVSPFGYSDVIVEGGMIFGKVPFPILAIHRANQTFAYQIQSYNLMNFMEFMSDRYASINIDHSLNGMLLNKVPLIKKLHLREVASFKVLYGDISSKNRPENDPNLYEFARDKDGLQSSFGLGKAPYIEGSVGITNIFKLLRVDYVRRFSYLNNPHVSKWGIRAKIHVDF